MSKAFDFCIPHTPDWIHEIKYDGYRLRLERNGDLAPAGREPIVRARITLVHRQRRAYPIQIN